MATYRTTGYDAQGAAPIYQSGKGLRTIHAEFTVDISEAVNGDVYILGGPMALTDRVHRIMAPHGLPTFAAASDNDLGFFVRDDSGNFTALDADILWDGADFTSSPSTTLACDLLMHYNSSLVQTSTIGDLLSINTDDGYANVYLGLTINTKETTTDKTVDLDIVIEKSTCK